MARKSLFPKSVSLGFRVVEGNPFSKKSALVLFWLLSRYPEREDKDQPLKFSINQIARELGSSPNLVFRVIKQLEYGGFIQVRGSGTSKRHMLADPISILSAWLKAYSVQTKAKIYQFRIFDPLLFEKKYEQLAGSELIPALHTAAQSLFHSRISNLRSREYYFLSSSPEKLSKLGLEVQSHGYDLLMIKPYYESVVHSFARDPYDRSNLNQILILTFLDLYNFPVRGIEQAEILFRRHDFFRELGHFESLKPK